MESGLGSEGGVRVRRPEWTIEFCSRLRGDGLARRRNEEGSAEMCGLSCVEKRGE